VHLTLIEEDPFNPRTDFPEAEIAALANDIRAKRSTSNRRARPL
jgi:ParB-like chromosome segregation protein Spo0J